MELLDDPGKDSQLCRPKAVIPDNFLLCAKNSVSHLPKTKGDAFLRRPYRHIINRHLLRPLQSSCTLPVGRHTCLTPRNAPNSLWWAQRQQQHCDISVERKNQSDVYLSSNASPELLDEWYKFCPAEKVHWHSVQKPCLSSPRGQADMKLVEMFSAVSGLQSPLYLTRLC